MPQDPAALAGMVDLSKPKVFASQPTGVDTTPSLPAVMADQRIADLPIVR